LLLGINFIFNIRSFFIVLNKWVYFKSSIIAFLSEKKEETDKNIQFINQTNPISSYQLIGTSITTIISFLLPLLELVK
jgi:hypothetical protein